MSDKGVVQATVATSSHTGPHNKRPTFIYPTGNKKYLEFEISINYLFLYFSITGNCSVHFNVVTQI